MGGQIYRLINVSCKVAGHVYRFMLNSGTPDASSWGTSPSPKGSLFLSCCDIPIEPIRTQLAAGSKLTCRAIMQF